MKRVLPAIFLSLLLTTACQPSLATRGNLVDLDDAKMLSPGKSSKEDVRSILGTPTATASLDDNRWYYIGQNTSHYGFQAEKVTDRRVVTVNFDEQGLLKDITPIENSGRKVDVSERITPTSGHNLTVFQQVFGNLGRFNSKANDKGAPVVGPGDPLPGVNK